MFAAQLDAFDLWGCAWPVATYHAYYREWGNRGWGVICRVDEGPGTRIWGLGMHAGVPFMQNPVYRNCLIISFYWVPNFYQQLFYVPPTVALTSHWSCFTSITTEWSILLSDLPTLHVELLLLWEFVDLQDFLCTVLSIESSYLQPLFHTQPIVHCSVTFWVFFLNLYLCVIFIW